MTYIKLGGVRAFPRVEPTKEQAVSPSDGTACAYFERGDRNEHYKEV